MPGKVRRIVTAVNEAGRSYILSDSLLPAELAPGEPLRAGLWLTDSAPASNPRALAIRLPMGSSRRRRLLGLAEP